MLSQSRSLHLRTLSTTSTPVPSDSDATSSDDLVFDVTDSDFQQKVLLSDVPVVVDCHAEWCGPCKTLGPVLEAAVKAEGGRVKMAKIDVDENPELSGGLNVQSLPTVFGVFQGKLVGQFVGNKQPEEVQAFVKALAQAGAGAGGEPAAEPEPAQAEEADFVDSAALEALANEDGITPEDEPRLLADLPASEALLALAKLKRAQRDYPSALEYALTLLRDDKAHGDNAAQALLLQIFDDANASHPDMVAAARRRMSNYVL